MRKKISLYLIFPFLCFVILISGCRYVPEGKGIKITPDHSKIIYQCKLYLQGGFNKYKIWKHDERFSKDFLDVYDAATGKKLCSNSFDVESGYKLGETTNSAVIMVRQCGERFSFKVHDIKTGKLRFDNEEVRTKNGGLVFEPSSHRSTINQSGFTVEGNDGRVYLLDDATGIARKLNDNEWRDDNWEFDSYLNSYTSPDSVTIDMTGNTRKKVVFHVTHHKDSLTTFTFSGSKTEYKLNIESEELISSGLDFIDPMLMGVEDGSLEARVFIYYPSIHDKSIIICSKTKAFGNYEWLFTSIPMNSGKEQWSVNLVNPLSEILGAEEIKDAFVAGSNMVIITDRSANSLNLIKGKWSWNVRLNSRYE